MSKKNKLPYHRLMIDVEVDFYERLKAKAVENERSVAKQAKVFLKSALEYDEKIRQKQPKGS